MNAKLVIIIVHMIALAYELVMGYLADQQRKKPLPPEVADVYDPERYRKYLCYVRDKKRMGYVSNGLTIAIDLLLLFFGPFSAIEQRFPNVYLISLLTMLLFWVCQLPIEILSDWYGTFHIKEKYGLNRMDGKMFVHDELIGQGSTLVLTTVLLEVFTLLLEKLPGWTNGFTLSLAKTIGLGLILCALLFVLFVLLQLFAVGVMRIQYKFTPLEGPLREKIMELQSSSRKKVKVISVYDESKKSNSKNAFLLKLLWYREFGIADNFLDENSERELLAVLSHEIGHLKHKKTVWNYLQYSLIGIAVILFCSGLYQPGIYFRLGEWVRASFGITMTNVYLLMTVIGEVIQPIGFLIGLLHTNISRMEEYEADREAVRNGYGMDLIRTFKRLSNDELVNVNPHPVIEWLEYDHPGMKNRIAAIQKGIGRHE